MRRANTTLPDRPDGVGEVYSGGARHGLRDGQFTVEAPKSDGFASDRTIDGETVTVRGAMVNGVPRVETAFIRGKFPGKTP